MIVLKTPERGATVSMATSIQKKFIEPAEEKRRAEMDGNLTFHWYALEREGCDRSLPEPISFSWEEKLEENETAANGYYYLLISERADMSDPWVYITKETSLSVYNLKAGTEYFFCVQKEGKRSEVSHFFTENFLPRCLNIEGISNVRDMGGFAVEEGKIRQGLIYRGGEFELHMHLTPNGAEELRRVGMRTDIDMRGEAIGKVDYPTSALVGMQRVFVPSVPYEEVFKKSNRKALRAFFKPFANPKNYPLYYHCWGGADRTGTFAYILGAFLGMKEEDLIYEYEFTSLSIWGLRSRNYPKFQEFLEKFKALPGETLRQKAAFFLKTYASMTDKQLETIYNIMIEKA